ncbi:MAG: hypothetical protein Q9184_001744 [Pyrenodesmia sp. 2 TL-2023]
MSSSKDNPNRFGGLKDFGDDPMDVEMTEQLSSVESVTAAMKELPFNEMVTSPETGTKRPQPQAFEGNPLEAWRKLRKTTKEAQASAERAKAVEAEKAKVEEANAEEARIIEESRLAEEARLRAEGPTTYANVVKGKEERVQGPFQYDLVKHYEVKAGMTVDLASAIGGPRRQWPHLAQLKLIIDPGVSVVKETPS